MRILECYNLKKSFGKKKVIKDISFNVDEGDILGFIGPNGSGKTTTIKMILGMQSIDEGQVLIEGYDINKNFTKAISRVGAIVENPDFYMYLSGRKNLELIRRVYRDIPKSRIDEVCELVGLKARIDDKVGKYSLGMRQRLGIAQAILHHPRLLILDEPTNGLDPEGIKDLRDLLQKLVKTEKMSIMISSHNLAEIEAVCNRVCIIQSGVILEETSISKLKQANNLSSYRIEVSDRKKAEKIIGKEGQWIDDKVFTINVEKEKVPVLLQKLLKNKIGVYEVRLVEVTLEDAFLKKTGGNTID